MNEIRKTAPIILMIWPYLSALALILPGYGTVLPLYIIFTVIVLAFNIWNAWTYPNREDTRSLAFWDMTVKLVHIPFYAGVFALGLLLLLAMVVPAFIFVSPILISVLAVTDFFFMLTSSMYGISAAVRFWKEGRISKKTALLHIILHLFFLTDVVSAVCLYRLRNR